MSAETEIVKRGKGRPPGSKNGIRFNNWQPKKWTVDYEMILLFHISGKTNKEIAESLGYVEAHVGNVLNCNLAKEKLNQARIRISERAKTIEDKLIQMSEKAVDRMYDYIHNESIATKTPTTMFDKSVKVLEMARPELRANNGNGNGNVTNNTLVLATEENVNKLLGAMANSKRAKELNAGEFTISTIRDKSESESRVTAAPLGK